MECTLIYGISASIKHRKTLPVAEAFRMIQHMTGYLFADIYYNDCLVYTTQGAAGSRYICDDCPYDRSR